VVLHRAAATPASGYASGEAADPIEAIEKALKASPAKPARVSKPLLGADPVTAAVIEEGAKVGGLSSEWTTP
jgi:hypothetical protein